MDRLLGGLRDGFFVEAGAYDGQTLSNSLFFELKRAWTGLLVEPNPVLFERLRTKNRRAWLFGQCLAPGNRPEVVEFEAAGLIGKSVG